MAISQWFSQIRKRQVVRPWALCAPVAVLVIALPLLRPLRSPGRMSEHEASRLATIEALVEHGTLSINSTDCFNSLKSMAEPPLPGDGLLRAASTSGKPVRLPAMPPGTIRVQDRYYSDKPPVLSFLLSWPYQLMYRLGWDLEHNPALVVYILTMLGVTLPVAGAAGLVYRMGRVFELRRPYRTALALAVVLGSGLIGYATVLNPHAPAAALLICACASLMHIANSRSPTSNGAWLIVAGLCASLAAVIDLSAGIFLVLLAPATLVLPWNWGRRISGMMLYAVGAAAPLILHAILTVPITGDWRPGYLHPELAQTEAPLLLSTTAVEDPEDVARPAPWKLAVWRALDRTIGALVGTKGLLIHWPVVVLGLIGMLLVLRRHWPAITKMLAAVTLAGSVAVIGAHVFSAVDWDQAMLGPRWFIVFLPLAVFWAGAWLRRPHRRSSWAAAGLLLAFSTAVSVIAAAAPFVHSPPGQYSVVAAIRHLSEGDRPSHRPAAQVLAAPNEAGE